ncbi:hypothetical protein [Pseudomonas tohonis]|uniref:hypothetical protein n=1 Tax=Pseudomonas tohonis TaxID=2725477 RepID=UPI0022F0B0FE|nr:hypothetical protein [Pseudomonas tohonis]
MSSAKGVFPLAWNKSVKPLAFAVQAAVFFVITFYAVFAITEMSAREGVVYLADNELKALNEEFVAASSRDEINGANDTQFERDAIREYIYNIKSVKRKVQSLITVGALNDEYSLRCLESMLNIYRVKGVFDKKKETSAIFPDGGSGQCEKEVGEVDALVALDVTPEGLLKLSSDVLLAIVVICCGALGALIGSLRSGVILTLQAFCIGLAAGLIVFLAIKGGRSLFLHSSGEMVMFNPYASAFAGLLAGLFTEKAYALISDLVDALVANIRGAFKSPPSPPPVV